MIELARKALAELLGAGFLTAAVVGSGIAATRRSPGSPGLQLLENSLVTGAVLVALVLALQPVSASFNPVVTLVEVAFGRVPAVTAAALMLAQLAGAALGAVAANVMFGVAALQVSDHVRSSGALWFSEVVATTGLVVVVFTALRSERSNAVAFAVGGYIAGAYWFTSSTSFANPAVTLARSLSDTFAGIAPSSVPMFVLMQLVGGLAGYLLVRALLPAPVRRPPGRRTQEAGR